MDRFQLLRCFIRVADRGSFSAVAAELGLSQSAVSKQIAALESQLRVRLLHRSTHELSLTAEGQRFLARARDILEAIDEAEAELHDGSLQPRGWLRVSCPLSFGQLQILPRLAALQSVHPELAIDLQMSDGYVDLIRDGIDVAIRIGNLPDSSLIARPLGTSMRTVIGSRAYLNRYGIPESPDALTEHRCIIYTRSDTGDQWSFRGERGSYALKVRGALRVDSHVGVRAAVLAGLGLAMAPTWLFPDELKNGSVAAALRSYDCPPQAISAVYPSRRYVSPKLRALIDFLREEFELDPMVSRYGADEA